MIESKIIIVGKIIQSGVDAVEKMDWKKIFLAESDYEDSTLELLNKIFKKVADTESKMGKDASEFSTSEVKELLVNYNSQSRDTLKTAVSFLDKYYQWCYSKGLVEKDKNPYDNNSVNEVIEEIIPDEIVSKSYFSKEYLLEYIDMIPDYINKFIILCLFYGIKGDEFTEILNLRMENLDEQNHEVRLADRNVEVDDVFIEYMKKADGAVKYIKEIDCRSRNENLSLYVKNGFVIKHSGVNGGSTDNAPAIPRFINNRLESIRKQTGNPYLTVSKIYMSGLISYIKDKYDHRGIELKNALLEKKNGTRQYIYENDTKSYINKFGNEKLNARMLRKKIKSIVEALNSDIQNSLLNENVWSKVGNIAILTINENIFRRNYFEINDEVADIWGIRHLVDNEKQYVYLIYLEKIYKLHFQREEDDELNYKLYWQDDFRKMIYSKFKHKNWNDKPFMRFEQINTSKFIVNFIAPDYIVEELNNDDEVYIKGQSEGKEDYYTSRRYERSRINRMNAIKIHGTICKCCRFDFEKKYGDIGMGFIEIHHITPLSTLRSAKDINPTIDLVPVCSNCHRIIHKNRDRALTVDEVKKLILDNC